MSKRKSADCTQTFFAHFKYEYAQGWAIGARRYGLQGCEIVAFDKARAAFSTFLQNVKERSVDPETSIEPCRTMANWREGRATITNSSIVLVPSAPSERVSCDCISPLAVPRKESK